jgi:hypothetical protein
MEKWNQNRASISQVSAVIISFLLGWHLGPKFLITPKALDNENAKFYYKMGKLNVFRPASPGQFPNLAKDQVPHFSRKKVTENLKTQTVTALPEIKFIDPKTTTPNTLNKPNSKADKNKVTNAPTQNKKANSLIANHPNSTNNLKAQTLTDQKSNPIVAEPHSPHKLNPIGVSGLNVIGNLNSQTGPNPSLRVTSSNNNSNRISEEKWASLMLQNPNFETAKQFFNAYRSGDVSPNVYFSTAKNLAFEPSENQKQVGLYLLSLETSTLSFRTLFEVLQRDTSLQPSIDLILTNYQSGSGILALLPLLSESQPDKLVLLALQQIEKALISKSVDFTESSTLSSILNPRRRASWERFGMASSFDLRSRLLSVIAQLLKANSLGREVLDLAQGIELRIKESRVVAVD